MHSLKRNFIFLFLFFSFFSLQTVSAHQLEIDHQINGVMHIDPDDLAVLGKLSPISFTVTDKTATFNPSQCDCTLIVRENNKQIAAPVLHFEKKDPKTFLATTVYTFSNEDGYSLIFSGKPKKLGAFQPFTLAFSTQVKKSYSFVDMDYFHLLIHHSGHLILILAATGIFFYLSERNARKNKV